MQIFHLVKVMKYFKNFEIHQHQHEDSNTLKIISNVMATRYH